MTGSSLQEVERCKNTDGYCGLIIARGLMGLRADIRSYAMMALFEARFSPKDLGIGMLQLMPQIE